MLIALLASLLSVQAQTKPIWNVSVGGSFPIGYFASFSFDPNTLYTDCGFMNENVNCGAAVLGINLGIEALFPMQNHKLFFTFSADFNYNGVTSDCKKYLNLVADFFNANFRSQVQNDGGTSVSSSCVVDGIPSHLNLPLLAGLRYTIPINNRMDLFAEGSVGANLRGITPITLIERMNYMYRGYYIESTIEEQFKYALKGSLAFRFGMGVRFAEHLFLSAYYYYLGLGDVSATIIAKDPTDNTVQPLEQSMQFGTINPMMVVVKLGYSL